jgi:prolipoprotein diacylglyceryltransferase
LSAVIPAEIGFDSSAIHGAQLGPLLTAALFRRQADHQMLQLCSHEDEATIVQLDQRLFAFVAHASRGTHLIIPGYIGRSLACSAKRSTKMAGFDEEGFFYFPLMFFLIIVIGALLAVGLVELLRYADILA